MNILRTFEAAGRYRSFALAAQELNISPPAVSQQIRQLEAYLDTPLFVRHHRKLSLTGTGQAYLDGVREALERLDAVTDQLFPDRSDQIVTIRCTPSVAMLWLVPNLADFHQGNPDIELSIRTLDQDAGGKDAAGADLEIVIGHDGNRMQPADKLFSAIVTPVCSPKLLEVGTRPERPEDLADFSLIHVLGYDDDWHRWFKKFVKGHKKAPGGLTVDGLMIAIKVVERGDGVMLGRQPLINSHLQSGELVDLFDGAYALKTNYFVRRLRPAKSGRAGERVVQWLIEMGGRTENPGQKETGT